MSSIHSKAPDSPRSRSSSFDSVVSVSSTDSHPSETAPTRVVLRIFEASLISEPRQRNTLKNLLAKAQRLETTFEKKFAPFKEKDVEQPLEKCVEIANLAKTLGETYDAISNWNEGEDASHILPANQSSLSYEKTQIDMEEQINTRLLQEISKEKKTYLDILKSANALHKKYKEAARSPAEVQEQNFRELEKEAFPLKNRIFAIKKSHEKLVQDLNCTLRSSENLPLANKRKIQVEIENLKLNTQQ